AFIVNQIFDLKKRGHKVVIFSFTRGSKNIRNEQLDFLHKDIIYGAKANNRFKRYFEFIALLFRHRFIFNFSFFKNPILYYNNPILLLDRKADILHCHFAPNAVRFWNENIAKGYFKTTKYICTFHGYDMRPDQIEINKENYKSIKENFHLFTYNTPYLGNLLKQCIPEVPMAEIPVGFNVKFLNKYYNPESPDKKKFKVLFCGR